MIDNVPTGSSAAPSSASTEGPNGPFPRISTLPFGRREILQIILDKATAAKLREPNQHALVRDADGKLLGVFKAMTPSFAATYQYALDTVDPEELERAGDPSRPSYTIEEVREHLRQLEREEAECASR